MGIKYLNKYLNKKCSGDSIYIDHLSNYSNKTIVVDTSIYLYKFLGENALIEYMYIMITLFMKYNITTIFVFDGKPPDEKKNIIRERRKAKREAETEYNNLHDMLEDVDSADKKQTIIKMENLKKRFIRVKNNDIRDVQEMMNYFNILYVEANGEADELCAKLCVSGLADACLSDDMDMFAYGCPKILRNLNMVKHNVQCYDYVKIINELQIRSDNMKDILILSKNDYNTDNSSDLYETLKWHNEWRAAKTDINFIEWLYTTTKYIKDYEQVVKIRMIFTLDEHIEMNVNNMLSNKSSIIDKKGLAGFLHNHGFIFV